MKGMLSRLRQLHPRQSYKQVLLLACVLGPCISLFLAVFEPFGFNQVAPSFEKYMAIAGYGIITSVVVVINGIVLPALLPRVYKSGGWTLAHDIFLQGFLNFFFIGVFNLLYSVWVFGFELNAGTFLFYQLATLSVGFLPNVIVILARHNQLLRQNTTSVLHLNENLENMEKEKPGQKDIIELVAETGNQKLLINVPDFIFAESADNYIKIHFLEGGNVKMEMIRFTLKRLESFFEHNHHVARCHRTYIVNLDFVSSFSGNAQGLSLFIDKADVNLPVSRSMAPVILEQLRKV